MVLVGRSSDRTGERFLHIAIPSVIGAIGFVATGLISAPMSRDGCVVRGRGRRLRDARAVLGVARQVPDGQRGRRRASR